MVSVVSASAIAEIAQPDRCLIANLRITFRDWRAIGRQSNRGRRLRPWPFPRAKGVRAKRLRRAPLLRSTPTLRFDQTIVRSDDEKHMLLTTKNSAFSYSIFLIEWRAPSRLVAVKRSPALARRPPGGLRTAHLSRPLPLTAFLPCCWIQKGNV